MSESNPVDPALLLAILDRLEEDLSRGPLPPLAHYQALFKGHEAAVASEYSRLVKSQASRSNPDSESAGPTISSSDFSAESPDRLDAPLPEVLGAYRIEALIGRGGQGSVYRAVDQRLERTVALKVLDAAAVASLETVGRFRREAEMTARVEHPGICPVYEIGYEGLRHFIAMRLVEGSTLASQIEAAHQSGSLCNLPEQSAEDHEQRRAPPGLVKLGTDASTRDRIRNTVAFFQRVAACLHVAHEAGVVHRDIKPANIMVEAQGQPVVLDFGLAFDDAATRLTMTGNVYGTLPYMSPEQTIGRIGLDRRTDNWSLGACLFECLAGVRPFHAPSRREIEEAIITKEPLSLSRLNPAIGKDLRKVVMQCLAKDRDRRYQTAGEVAEELAAILEGRAVRARPERPAERAWRWIRRHAALTASTTLVILALAAALLVTRDQMQRRGIEYEKRLELAERERERLLRESWSASVANLLESAQGLWPRTASHAALEAWLAEADGLQEATRRVGKELEVLGAQAQPWTAAERQADERWWIINEPRRYAEWQDLRRSLPARVERLETLKAALQRAEATEPEEKLIPWRSGYAEEALLVEQRRQRLTELSSRIEERRSYRFENPASAERHGKLRRLQGQLDRLAATRRAVEQRAAAVRAAEKAASHPLWAQVRATLRERRGAYADHAIPPLEPQPGLVPLGRDQGSGLWEFYLLGSGTPPTWEEVPGEEGSGRGRIVLEAARDERVAMVFVLLPGGRHRLGLSHAKDPHGETDEENGESVRLDGFFMGKWEVTHGQWEAVLGDNPSPHPPGYGEGVTAVTARHPITEVDWDDCVIRFGRLRLVLPTEAQWEYAASAGRSDPWWCGPEITSPQVVGAVNVADESLKRHAPELLASERTKGLDDGHVVAAPVGSLAPNPFGLQGIIGNVYEWCRDAYALYGTSPVTGGDGLRLSVGPNRVARGGSWLRRMEAARTRNRESFPATSRYYELGCRLVAPIIED